MGFEILIILIPLYISEYLMEFVDNFNFTNNILLSAKLLEYLLYVCYFVSFILFIKNLYFETSIDSHPQIEDLMLMCLSCLLKENILWLKHLDSLFLMRLFNHARRFWSRFQVLLKSKCLVYV